MDTLKIQPQQLAGVIITGILSLFLFFFGIYHLWVFKSGGKRYFTPFFVFVILFILGIILSAVTTN